MRPHPRPGLSLTEVLVAMFVMALGLMALLTLFPLGAMQVGQALKDDRTAQAAQQADGWLRVYWRAESKHQSNPNPPLTSPSPNKDHIPGDGLLGGFDDPNVTYLGSAEAIPADPMTGTPAKYSTIALVPYGGGTLYTLPATGGQTFNPLETNADGQPLTRVSTSLTGATIRATGGANPGDEVGTRDTMATPNASINPLFTRYLGRFTRTGVASYPILFDPLGCLNRGPGNVGRGEQIWAGYRAVYGVRDDAKPVLLPRRNPRATSSRTFALEYRQGDASVTDNTAQSRAFAACALTDDLTYQPNGGAGGPLATGGTEPLGRQGRYTWAAVVQRPRNDQLQDATLTVLVFDGRPINLAPEGDEAVLTNDPANNVVFHSGATAGARSLELKVPARGADQPPLVRRGGWLAVALLEPLTATQAGFTARPGVRRMSFHRITGLSTNDDQTVPRHVNGPTVAVTPVAVDIDPPLPAEFSLAGPEPTPARVPLAPQVYLFAGLSEVFERPNLTR